jgi:TPR repeat protein
LTFILPRKAINRNQNNAVRTVGRGQGCQIFLGAKYQNGEKFTEKRENLPNGHKIYQKAVKLTK